MFIRRRSRKRLDREIDEVVSFEPTTDHYGEKDGTTGGAWPARYSTGSTAQGSIHNGSDGTHGQPGYGAAMPNNRYSNGLAYGQQQPMAQNGYPGYGGNQAYQGYNIPAQNQAYPAPAPPRSPAVAYDPARAVSPPNPIAPYSAPVLPQLNFASTGPQFGNIASEKPLPPALYPGQAQSSEEASYVPVERAPAGTASSETRHSPSNSVERKPSTPVLAYAAAPEQGSRLSNATSYGGAPASVDERAGYTPGGLTVCVSLTFTSLLSSSELLLNTLPFLRSYECLGGQCVTALQVAHPFPVIVSAPIPLLPFARLILRQVVAHSRPPNEM